MSYARFAAIKLTLSRALLLAALPTACAVGVTPEDTGGTSDQVNTAGTSAGGSLGTSGSTTTVPKAGTTGSAGSAVVNPFGGSASTGGSAGSSSGGQSTAGASGSSHGGSAGAAGAAGSSAGGSSAGGSSGGSGGGTGICACPTKKPWADDTSINFVSGDCFDVAGAVYVYTGTKAQTWAHKDCNPAKQLTWCSDMGADYKFTLCK